MIMSTWKRTFLASRGLSAPTGLPLYTYRTSKQEFEDLELMLQNYLADQLRYNSLGDVARDDSRFCGAFVFYASEWWKRRFNGHHWSWSPIVEDLGAKANDWCPNRRSACVESGLSLWNLNLPESQGFHYLATIAFNGGLPLRLVSEAQGSIGKILSRVMKNASGVEEPTIMAEWIKSISAPLPSAYQRDEIYLLLAKIAQQIINLKKEASLDNSEGALEKLERTVPMWRERLPISMDDVQTTHLINQLVSEVAGTKREGVTTSRLRALRTLDLDIQGTWRIRSTLELPQFLEAEQVKKQFPDSGVKEQQRFSISLRRGDSEYVAGFRKLAGQERFRLDRVDTGCEGLSATAEHVLILLLRDGSTYHSPLSAGEALDEDAPWIFSAENPESSCGSFLRQREGKIPSRSAILAVPEGWKVQEESKEQIRDRGWLEEPRRRVFSVTGTVILHDPAGAKYRISCGHMEEEYSYDVCGQRVWDSFIRPAIAVVGEPRLERINLETGMISRHSITRWRCNGGTWQTKSVGLYGPVKAQYIDHGELLWRGRMVLLPEGYRNELIGGDKPESGSVILWNSGAQRVVVRTPGVQSTIELETNRIIVRLSVDAGEVPPEQVELQVSWLGNPDSARLKLPFPAKGIRIHNGDGAPVFSGSKIPLQSIAGIRITAFAPSGNRGRFEIILEDEGRFRKIPGVDRDLVFDPVSHRLEIRLVEYETELRKTLSLGESLDCFVRLVITIPDCEPAELLVSHFATRLELAEGEGRVRLDRTVFACYDMDRLECIKVHAIRLDLKGEEPLHLEALRSESVHCGEWIFPAATLEPGPWLIYPDAARPYEFRPALWPIDFNEKHKLKDFIAAERNLTRAIQIIDRDLRATEIREALQRMIKDSSDSGWAHVDWMANQLGHLPLSSLDVWRGFVQIPESMAMLAFRLGGMSSEFLGRFPEELPFLWEAVPLRAWVTSIRAMSDQINRLPDSIRAIFSQNPEDARKGVISSACPQMDRVFELAQSIAKIEGSLDSFHRRMKKLAPTMRESLFEGHECEYQRLLQRHVEGKWPDFLFSKELGYMKRSAAADLVWVDDMSYRNNIINAPVLLATQMSGLVDLGLTMVGDLVTRIRIARDFDPDWFDKCYSDSIIRCLAMRKDLQDLARMEQKE